MTELTKEMKVTKFLYISVAIIIMIVGLSFSYLLALLEDAPGLVFIGGTITLLGAYIVYGIGEIIIELKKNNELLANKKK